MGWERTFYPSITGQVVDGETGEPIEGAVLLCLWTKTKGIPGLSSPYLEKVVETVSEKEGRFRIEGTFDPLLNPPDLTAYKRGYVAWNNKEIFPTFEKRTDFKWKDGLIVKIEKWNDEYSFIEHESFISGYTDVRDVLDRRESLFFKAKEWETDLRVRERDTRRKSNDSEGGIK